MAESHATGYQGYLSSSDIQESRSSLLKSSITEHGKKLIDIDEIDGFVGDKVEGGTVSKYFLQQRDKYNSTFTNAECYNEVDTVDVNFEKYGCSNVNVKSDLKEKEPVKRFLKNDTKSGIEMFDDVSNGSSGNSFTIEGFHSLNGTEDSSEFSGVEDKTSQQKKDLMDVKDDKSDNSNSSGDQEFPDIELSTIENESQDNAAYNEYLECVERTESLNKYLGISIQTSGNTRSDSFYVNIADEKSLKKSDKVLRYHKDKHVQECHDFENLNNLDSKCEEKYSIKKSRKQNIPKRVKKVSPIENVCDVGENVTRFTDSGDDDDLDTATSKGNRIPDDTGSMEEIGIETWKSSDDFSSDDKLKINDSHEISKDKEKGGKKSEKSRKQCKPKRIDQLQIVNKMSRNLDNFKAEAHAVTDVYIDGKLFNGIERKGLDMQCFNTSSNVVDTVEENDDGNYSVSEKKYVKNHEEFAKGPEERTFTDNGSNNVNMIKESKDMTSEGGTIDHFASLSSNPFYYGFSQNLNLISTLSPGMLQGGSSSPRGFALDENGPENLEVIRHLREIRCNRYRKISIAEKREISAYANTHGVSQAAAYYNVSKSAVSMWTKLDFSNADEESIVKRKNCMSGNEKFEALCRKVKNERENKFKGMSKEDKFEVSRYAKLVGVREMSRCLGVALGTVSGWMRQFPYKVETDPPDGTDTKSKYEIKDNTIVNKTTNRCVQDEKLEFKRKKSEQNSKRSKKQKFADELDKDQDKVKRNEVDNTRRKEPINHMDKINTYEGMKESDKIEFKDSGKIDCDGDECKAEQKDELDKMIEETLQKPDTDKCFEGVKDLIKDSPLENDCFFRSLFDRVIACRADKYKTLKPSEKLEVVRYAKRIGVRRVAKIMGLATGTLSGWNTKYQSSLDITDPSLEMSNKTELLVSYLSPDKNAESIGPQVSQAALMDNISEKSEVTAVKILFKDRFHTLLQKIEVAKQIKFRNITVNEKIEFVKCSKLVGIRPTARVFGIPIGTLSGWITKYSKLLHPAYHVDVDNETGTSSTESSSQFSDIGVNHSSSVGRSAIIPGCLGSNPAWPQGLVQGSQELDINLFSQLQGISTSQTSSSFPVLHTTSPSSLATETDTLTSSYNIAEDDKKLKTSLDNIYQSNQSDGLLYSEGNPLLRYKTEYQSEFDIVAKSEQAGTQSDIDNNFEKEAKLLAEQYLTTAYKTTSIPI